MAQMATAKPTRKVFAGAAGGVGFGGAVNVLLLYGLERLNGEPLPTVVAASVAIVVTAALGFVTSYFTPPSSLDVPVATPPPATPPVVPPAAGDGGGIPGSK